MSTSKYSIRYKWQVHVQQIQDFIIENKGRSHYLAARPHWLAKPCWCPPFSPWALQLPAVTSFFLFHSFPAFLPAAKMDNTPWVTRCSSTSSIGNPHRAPHLETAGSSKHSHKRTCWQQEPPADWFSIFSLPRHRAWPVWELQTMTRLTQQRLTTCKSSLKENCPGQHVPDGRQRFTREKIQELSSCNGMNRTRKH